MTNNLRFRFAYNIAMIVPTVGFFACFAAAYVSGTRENWYGFGMSILFCVFNNILFAMVVLSRKIDVRFSRIEELIRENQGKENGG